MLAAVYAQHRTVPPGHQHLPPGYQTERSALDALFGATGGLHSYDQYADAWTRRDGWDTDIDHCSRFGVVCDRHGRVTKVLLNSNKLKGSIHADISNLASLTSLDLGNNAINGYLCADDVYAS